MFAQSGDRAEALRSFPPVGGRRGIRDWPRRRCHLDPPKMGVRAQTRHVVHHCECNLRRGKPLDGFLGAYRSKKSADAGVGLARWFTRATLLLKRGSLATFGSRMTSLAKVCHSRSFWMEMRTPRPCFVPKTP